MKKNKRQVFIGLVIYVLIVFSSNLKLKSLFMHKILGIFLFLIYSSCQEKTETKILLKGEDSYSFKKNHVLELIEQHIITLD